MRPTKLWATSRETLSRSYAVVKKGGVLATTVEPVDESAANRAGIHAVQVIMRRSAGDLAELARLVEKGALKPRLFKTMNLSQAREKRRNSAKPAKRKGR